MSTFKYDPSKYAPSQCGVCRTRIVEGDEVCFISKINPSENLPGKTSYIMLMAHVDCAKQEGYSETKPDQTTWMRSSSKTTRRIIKPE